MSALAPTAVAPPPLMPVATEQVAQAEATELVDLVRSAVAGDKQAVDSLITEIRPKVMKYCRGRLGRNAGRYELADDVAQETCLAIVTALPRFQDMGRPFLAFVYGIAAHKVADAQRKEMRTPLPVDELPDSTDDTPGPEESVVRLLQARQARDLLENLPTQQREILLLRVIGGMSAGETGKALGLTTGNVRVQQHRALTRLRGMISRDDIMR